MGQSLSLDDPNIGRKFSSQYAFQGVIYYLKVFISTCPGLFVTQLSVLKLFRNSFWCVWTEQFEQFVFSSGTLDHQCDQMME